MSRPGDWEGDSGELRPVMSSESDPHRPRERLTVRDEQRSSARVWLAVFVGVALSVRLLIFALGPMGDLSLAMDADSARYVALADHLVRDEAFALDAAADDGLPGRVSALRVEAGELPAAAPDRLRPETYRTPGYPLFLALFQWFNAPGSAVLIVQCALGALCVMLTYRLAMALLDSPRAALAAAAVMALHPAAVAATNVLLPDTLWLTLMLGGLALVVRAEKSPAGAMAVGGVLLGFAALVQPYALLLPVMLAMWACLRRRNLQTVAAALLLLVAAAVPVGAWVGRNYFIGAGPQLSSQPVIDRYFHTLGDMRLAAGEDASPDALAAAVSASRIEGESVLHTMDRLADAAIAHRSDLNLVTLRRNAAHLFTDHSLETMYRQFGIAYQSPPVTQQVLASGFHWRDYVNTGDDATFHAALAWTLLNAALLLVAVVGLIVMVVRGQWAAALLLVGLLAFAVVGLHSGLYGRPQLPALAFEAALIGGLLVPGRVRPARAKLTATEKREAKTRKRQQQSIGTDRGVHELTREHDPIIPGQGPRESIRPI